MYIFNHLIFKDLINTQMLSLLGGHGFLDFQFLPELMKKTLAGTRTQSSLEKRL
jgi:hypothetical protein